LHFHIMSHPVRFNSTTPSSIYLNLCAHGLVLPFLRSFLLEKVVTRDGKRAAQYEHTVAITADGYELLTAGNPMDGW